jgi:hypothetical protein
MQFMKGISYTLRELIIYQQFAVGVTANQYISYNK